MTRDHFDLEKVRKNWERAVTPEPSSLAPRFADVRAPLDPYEAARGALARVRSQALARFPEHTESIEPFFTQAADLLVRMEAAGAQPADAEAPAADAAASDPRRDFEQVLWDLEDLFEVFSGIGR